MVIEDFIQFFRQNVPEAKRVFSNGACFLLYQNIKLVEPAAEAWYDGINGHVYTKLYGVFYDINGRFYGDASQFWPLSKEPRILAEAYTWEYKE